MAGINPNDQFGSKLDAIVEMIRAQLESFQAQLESFKESHQAQMEGIRNPIRHRWRRSGSPIGRRTGCQA